MMATRTTKYTYGKAALAYYNAGWSPLPAKGKTLLVSGVSGAQRLATFEEIDVWAEVHSSRDILLRLPPNVLALDVDVYKGDLDKLAKLEAKLGKLPITWNSDARGGEGGKLLFRVSGTPQTRWLSEVGGITICQHTHRYVMAWPSYNTTAEAEYRWYFGLGGDEVPNMIPHVNDLAELPDIWHIELRLPDEDIYEPATYQPVEIPQVDYRQACAHMQCLADDCEDTLTAAVNGIGTLHDTGLMVLGRLIKARNYGHPGFEEVAKQLGRVFASAQRADRDLETEWDLAVTYVQRRAANEPREQLDPCDIKIIYTPKTREQQEQDDYERNLQKLRGAGLSLSEAKHILRRGKW